MGNRRVSSGPVEPGPRKARMVLVAVCFALGLAGLFVRSWWLMVHRNEHFLKRSAGQHQSTVELRARRGAIHDRNGRELALSAMVPSVYAVPKDIKDPVGTAKTLAGLLEVDEAVLRRRLSSGKSFAWVKRHVSPRQAEAVKALEQRGLALQDEPRRFYPNRALAGPIIGFAGIDGRGLEGVERDYDRYLRGKAYTLEALRDARGRHALSGGSVPLEALAGNSVTLTIDARIQQLAESSLIHQVREMEAKSGVVIVMDPHTGDVLAMAQTPAFDPNLFRHARPDDWRNRHITDVLEPGSTVKPFLISAALDLGKTRGDSVWDGYYGRLKVGRKTVTDVHGVDKLTTLEIVQKSSNVGAVQVAQRIGKEAWYRYLRAYGFGEATGLGLRGEQIGNLRHSKKWGHIHLATFSYGYGFSVTPVQMVRALSAVANGGNLMKPRLVKAVTDPHGKIVKRFEPQVLRRVIKAETAKEVTKALVMVTQKGGTGRRARVPGFVVGGKTGTAHKVDPLVRGYSKTKVQSSFNGMVPAHDPRLVIYVCIDEPKVAHYGGVVAAPVFAAIAKEALPYLGVEATEEYSTDDYADEEELDEFAEGIDPQARPWWFEEASLTGAPSHMVVPDLAGRPLTEVVEEAGRLNLRLEVEGAGLVISQHPQAGSLLPKKGALAVVMHRPGTRRASK